MDINIHTTYKKHYPGIQSRIEPIPTDPTAIDGAILEESVVSAGNMENDDKYMDNLNT